MALRLWLSLACLIAVTGMAAAQDPVVNGTAPGAIRPGQPTDLLLQGGNLAPAKLLWTDAPVTVALTEGVAENGTKADQVTYRFTAGSDAPVGIYGLRVLTDKGVSPLRFLLIDDLPSMPQAGNNTTAAMAQAVPNLTAVDGAIANLTVQYFKVTVAQGQKLSVEVLARRIGSSLDPMLRVLDLKGRELAFSDDAPGLSGDSQMEVTFPVAGDFLIELRDIRYQGGPYRLRIGDFPCAALAYPLAIHRGQTAAVTLAGSAVDNVVPVNVTAAADSPRQWLTVSAKRQGGASSGFSQIAVVNRPQVVEVEPNNAAEQSQRVELTGDLNGRFDAKGDVDRFVFAAKKDQSVTFTGITRTQGSPADLNLKVLNKDGGQIAAVDDTGTNEGQVTVKFPADGDYTLVVEELSKRGGAAYCYRVAVEESPVLYTLAASADTLNVPAGGSLAVTVTAARNGMGAPIELSVRGLPEGLTASRSIIGPGRNDAVLTITAKPDAPPAVLHGVQIVGTAQVGAQSQEVVADMAGVLRARFANMRFPPASLITGLAAAVAPAPGFTWRVEPAEITFGKDLSAKVKFIAQRGAGFDEAIAMALLPPANGVPPNVAIAVKNIDKGAGEVDVVFSANNQAPLGDFTVGFTGSLKQGDKTVVQPAAVRFQLAAPLTVAAEPAGGKIAKGGELVVKVKAVRNPALAGPLTITLKNLPAGITAAPATIAADASEVDVKLTAAADAAAANVNNVVIAAEATVGDKKFAGETGNLPLTVE